MDLLKKNLDKIISPFIKDMNQYNFTPTELEVARYIRDGKSTKDMADILNLAVRSIDFYRYNICKKPRINNKVNLRSCLLSLESESKQKSRQAKIIDKKHVYLYYIALGKNN